ncbi:unnamed protein product [Boreogadus saida]
MQNHGTTEQKNPDPEATETRHDGPCRQVPSSEIDSSTDEESDKQSLGSGDRDGESETRRLFGERRPERQERRIDPAEGRSHRHSETPVTEEHQYQR